MSGGLISVLNTPAAAGVLLLQHRDTKQCDGGCWQVQHITHWQHCGWHDQRAVGGHT
jgi:hypothetical protein